jgi:hypothetical protein
MVQKAGGPFPLSRRKFASIQKLQIQVSAARESEMFYDLKYVQNMAGA